MLNVGSGNTYKNQKCLLLGLGDEVQLDSGRWNPEDGSRRLLFSFVFTGIINNFDVAVVLNAPSKSASDETRMLRSSNLVHLARRRSWQGEFGINVSRTFPFAFAESLGSTGERWIKAIEVPVQGAEVAVGNLPIAHGRLTTSVAKDQIVLVVLESQGVGRHVVPVTCSRQLLKPHPYTRTCGRDLLGFGRGVCFFVLTIVASNNTFIIIL